MVDKLKIIEKIVDSAVKSGRLDIEEGRKIKSKVKDLSHAIKIKKVKEVTKHIEALSDILITILT